MTKQLQDSKRIRNKKRILSVTIRRMIDDSPDTSYLGEYRNRPKTEYAIDRAHSEDCESVQPGFESDGDWSSWNRTAKDMLERVRLFLEEYQAEAEHEGSSDGCPETCAACEEEQPYTDAVETVWELEKNAGECDCHGGNMERGQYRYFNGPVENYKGLEPAEIRKYIRQDYDRMESLNRGDFCFIGIRAEAEIGIGDFSKYPAKFNCTIQRISSGGLWGIESDSGRDYLESVEKDELENLREQLKALGFSSRAISAAFKPENIKEKND